MNRALLKYKVDCVIGNILGRKDYVRIRTKEGREVEYTGNVEQRIVEFLLTRADE